MGTRTVKSATTLTLGSIENEFCPTHRSNWRQVLRSRGKKEKVGSETMVPEHLSFSKLFAELTSQKDFFVGVKGVDDQRHQLTDIGGEGEGLDVCGVGRGFMEKKNKCEILFKTEDEGNGKPLMG